MILQQLWADADAIMKQTGQDEPLPSMYNPKRVRWEVRLRSAPEGFPPVPSFVGPFDSDKKRGLVRIVPDCKRTVGVRPILLVDKVSYALGVGIPDAQGKSETKISEKHAAFTALAMGCAADTGDASVATVAEFLSHWNPDDLPAETRAAMRGDDLLEFVANDVHCIDEPKVRGYWAAYGREADESAENDGQETAVVETHRSQCLISGVRGPVEKMMPLAVKGIPGGQPAGMHIVSANAAAFESYGLERAQTSPISRDAGERFGKALNALIASERHHQRAADITYVFWSRAGIVPLDVFAPPADPGELKKFIRAAFAGDRWHDLPNEARFYMFGLSPNAARVVVRSALDREIGEVFRAQANWFTRLEIIGGDGQPGKPLPLKTLAVAAYRDFKDIAPSIEDALVQAALNGDPLPASLLQAVVLRCRLDTENRVTYPRAALLKYILTQSIVDPKETIVMSTEVSDSADLPFTKPAEKEAYHCGRLFAELEDIQRAALPGINATISDRFFGAASTAPATVFGTLLSGARDHLGKLRRTREGAYHNAERRLEEIMAEIGSFPNTLLLKDQALFSLGYYHHKAAKRKDIAERAAAKRQAGTTTKDNPDDITETASSFEGDTNS